MRRFLATVLARAGFKVRAVESGKEALESYQAKKAALVILDVCMPEMDGLETLQALRAMDPKVKVIGMSGMGPGAATLFLKMMGMVGAFATLEKPFTPEAFLKTVQKALGLTQEPIAVPPN